MANTQRIGQQAEALACHYLEQRGLSLVKRNYRTRRGEIDLIMRTTDYLVFVEVRYRKRSHFGSPAETIGVAKQRRIIACASAWLQKNPEHSPCRFDVVSIESSGGSTIVEWIADAFHVQ